MRLAAIDIGTNSTRLLIVEHFGSSFQEIYRDLRSTRIGEGLAATSLISPAALQRTIAALQEYHAIIQKYEINALGVVATSAIRDATNKQWVIEQIKAATAMDVMILSGEEEAKYSYLGASCSIKKDNKQRIIIDIGGGSTELIYPTARGPQFKSVNVGAVRLKENPEIKQNLTEILEQLLPNPLPAEFFLIGLGGTITTLAAIKLGLVNYDQKRIEALPLSLIEIQEAFERITATPLAERKNIPGLPEARADIILSGILILKELMLLLGQDTIIVSEQDILQGIINHLFLKTENQSLNL